MMAMKEYTIYKTSSGNIVGGGITNSELSKLILESDESIIEGNYEIDKYKIIDGKAVSQTVDFWNAVRSERNALLASSDWTQLSDSALSDSKKTEWATYRQALRDVPSNNLSASVRSDVNFPTEPT